MNIGMCLPGGGAKGAFQSGAIKRLYEKGVNPNIITGTSIGAVNSYFILRDSIKEMEYMWLNMDNNKFQGEIDKVIDNSKLIQELSELKGENNDISHAFVNYVEVENRKLGEKIVDIKHAAKEEALKAVGFSSLLPARGGQGDHQNYSAMKFDSQKVFEHFKEDVNNGIYDGYKLDGGILNNTLLAPFIMNRVDWLIIIALKGEFKVPEYIYEYYSRENIMVIEPDRVILPGDTLRFERDYCVDMFERGYRLAGNL